MVNSAVFKRSSTVLLVKARWKNEVVYKQMIEVLEKSSISKDSIDRVVSCVELRWLQTVWLPNKLSLALEYALIAVESAQGFVYIVKWDFVHRGFAGSSTRMKCSGQHYRDKANWTP